MLATNHKHHVLNRENLAIPIEIELSHKQKTFFHLFAAFWKSILNFKCFQEKYDAHRFCTSDITDSENVVR